MRVKKKYLSFFSLALLHKSKRNKTVIWFNKSVYSLYFVKAYDLSFENAKIFNCFKLRKFQKTKHLETVFRIYIIFLTIVDNLNLKVCCFIHL